ncbi:MAG: sulfite oxidase heme-binding subunit YedZ [Terriglobales bacterium]
MKRIRVLKPFIFVSCLAPLAHLVWKGLAAELGANPIEVITRSTGNWTLLFLLITLSVTPLRKVSGMHWLIQFRRMLGLFAFFYGCLHLLTYVWLDKFFDVQEMIKDIGKRPFITMGFTAFVLMVPLAITSTRKMIQRLGGKRWNRLHQLIYLSATAGAIHFYWLVKKDVTRPLIYAGILAALLGYRGIVRLLPAISGFIAMRFQRQLPSQ